MISLPRSDDLAPPGPAHRPGRGGPVSPGPPLPRVLADEDLAGFTAGQVLAVTKILTMILTLPQSAARRVDALVVAVGQGEEWRLTHAIRSWEANPAVSHLLVANGNPDERTYVDITLDYLRSLGLRRTDGVHLQAEPAAHTAVQAAWIVSQVRARGITSLALAVSPYHLARVYLTVLKALTKAGVRVPMIPLPVAVSPDTPVPETGATAYDLVPGEIKRILTYMEDGWVATPEEVRQYLQWLWSHRASLLVRTCESDTSADRSCP
ncbi:YdcF family protein [Micromonospora sp. MA102]|uniref:YdcF family protein n=1 Tax=Micromonospora sp. MA102 TaxID=2952755 RepID=UPI0021C5C78C|nr:YdcF family protein [Micromonospora sp. MA102]